MGNAQEGSPRHTRTAVGLLTLSLWPQAERDYPFLSKGVQRCPHDLSSAAQHHRALATQRTSNSPATSSALNFICMPCLFYALKLEQHFHRHHLYPGVWLPQWWLSSRLRLDH